MKKLSLLSLALLCLLFTRCQEIDSVEPVNSNSVSESNQAVAQYDNWKTLWEEGKPVTRQEYDTDPFTYIESTAPSEIARTVPAIKGYAQLVCAYAISWTKNYATITTQYQTYKGSAGAWQSGSRLYQSFYYNGPWHGDDDVKFSRRIAASGYSDESRPGPVIAYRVPGKNYRFTVENQHEASITITEFIKYDGQIREIYRVTLNKVPTSELEFSNFFFGTGPKFCLTNDSKNNVTGLGPNRILARIDQLKSIH